MKKKILSVALALVLMFSLVVPAFASGGVFTDVQGHWAQETILTAHELEVVGGFPDGTFRPNASITRAETVTILSRFFDMTDTGTVTFSDVQPNDWFYSAVAAAVHGGYVSGFGDGTFRPHNNITRLHAALILYRIIGSPEANNLSALDGFVDAAQIRNAGQESANAMAFFVELGTLRGYYDQTLRPNANISRAELLVLLFRIQDSIDEGVIQFERQPELDVDDEEVPLAPAPTPPTPAPGGGGGGGGGPTAPPPAPPEPPPAPPQPQTFTVTFNLYGGVLVEDIDAAVLVQTVNAGEDATPPTVIREGFIFIGWYPVGGYTNVTENRTITAVWQRPRLDNPQNLRTVTVATDGIGGGSGPHTPTGHRALEWDPVPGAEAYVVFAFLPGTMDVYRYQVHTGVEESPRPGQTPNVSPEVPITQFNIGHDSVVQARARFNFNLNNWAGQLAAPDQGLQIPYPTNAAGELAFHAMMASSRQSFDLPLPYREFDFRVAAIPPADSAYTASLLSEAYTTRPGARSLSAAQMGALVDDAIARGAGGRGFVQIETGTQGVANAGTAGVLFIPLSNQPAASYDYFDSAHDGFTNAPFLARAAFEIQNHPAYIGPETLIFTT